MYDRYVQVAGGTGNVERAVGVSPNEMEVEVERGGNRFSGATVRPTEMSVLSDGGEEASPPSVPAVRTKPRQAEQAEHHATGHVSCSSLCENCVSGRGRVSPT